MNEDLKREAVKAILKSVGTGGMTQIIHSFIDRATIAERNRIIKKINNLKAYDDNGVWSFVRELLLKSINREKI